MRDQCTDDVTPREQVLEETAADAPRCGRLTGDVISAWSFPAGDPPALCACDPVEAVDGV
jgi:hypothetical protein